MKKGVLLVCLVCIGMAAAMPYVLPEKYAGMVYIGGLPAKQGTIVSVEANNMVIDEFSTIGPIGRYNYVIDVYGIEPGTTLTWKVDGIIVPIEDYYEDGGFNVPFDIYAALQEDVTATEVIEDPKPRRRPRRHRRR